MKFLLIILTIVNTGCVLAVPPKMKFTLKVIDLETKQSITNASVWTGFTQKEDPWGIGVGKSYIIEEKIGSKGIATYSGNSVNGGHGGSVFAEGYYYSGFDFKYKTNKILNRWEPWNPTITVKLRPKKDPVPMVYKRIELKKIPKKQIKIGFDLEKGDWVAPYGKGKIADFIFIPNWYSFDPIKGSEGSYKLVFSNPDDGIQEYEFPKNLDSSFKWAYVAPTNNYSNILEQKSVWTKTGRLKKGYKNCNYIFRVRSKRNKKGKIISACYGRIKGPIDVGPYGKFNMEYWFNPNPKSRSLESKNKPY
jgi:hypothetical protein